jgi:hypothetical protein
MITVFVDESGDLGQNGSQYFVIAFIMPQKGKRIANFMKTFCAENGLEEVKAYQLSFPQKQVLFNKLNLANDYTISYIVADKQHIGKVKLFQDNNLLYNYLFSFLIKKTIKSAQEDICILLDNRSLKTKSINSLSDYIRIKAATEWNFKYNLQVSYVDSKDSKTVQVADIIANAIFSKYSFNKSHFYNSLTISESIHFPQETFGKDV